MAVSLFNQPNTQGRFIAWKRLILILGALVMMCAVWVAYKTVNAPSEKVNPAEMHPPAKERMTAPAKTDEEANRTVSEPISKPLNLNIAPVEDGREEGPILVDDIIESAATEKNSTLPKSPPSPLELEYGYKGRDKQGHRLELGATENSTQFKLGVQVDENKVNVNSIEVEIPLSK
ncbi:hypothetical protein CYQ88_08845 [Hydrogenovibrio sp. SC-1]|uniref:hypothetical protein n=1 Tax=Hydrogenovibrio sp. SC-1 TaxID=2065820 RepID=UPI000C7DE263|nr:hypothetical protein [Hydrogenovibrio sp. SC-1]PLA73931.1 hypothetical protein CYQ88_08845 [Hydrogenovibrio sp. SC-1]